MEKYLKKKNKQEQHSEKQVYVGLCYETMKFVFTEPGPAVGVKSGAKVVLRINNVSIQYPIKDKPTIVDASLTASQVSRVGVIGANGAGKSMVVEVSVGEQKLTERSAWKKKNKKMNKLGLRVQGAMSPGARR